MTLAATPPGSVLAELERLNSSTGGSKLHQAGAPELSCWLDEDKKLSYSYNVLGLVDRFTVTASPRVGEATSYCYCADGTQIDSKRESAGGAVQMHILYFEGARYNGTTNSFYVSNPAGATLLSATNDAQHVFYEMDHLGNIMLAYSDLNGDGYIQPRDEVLEENRYSPLVWTGESTQGAPAQTPKQAPYTQQSTTLLFGYNGAEWKDNLGLHLTTYRTMAPMWGQVDPEAELMYGYSPYNSMAGNPISHNDPHGDALPFLAIVGIHAQISAIISAVGTALNGGDIGDIAGAWFRGAGIGAINGALAAVSPLKVPFGNSGFGLTLAPQLAVGSDGVGIGANATVGYNFKGFNAGVNLGGSYYFSAQGTGQSGFEGRLGYGIGYESKNFGIGVGSTYFASGGTSQQTGYFSLQGGPVKGSYENDTWAPVPGLWEPGGRERDKFRTTGVSFGVTRGKLKGAELGLRLFTGEATQVNLGGPNGTFGGGNADRFRLGAVYAGYNGYRAGYNSERNIRGPIQNGFHDLQNYPRFRVLGNRDRFYGGYFSSSPYTLW